MAETNTEKAAASEEERFSRERLIADSFDFTGHPSHVMAGALAAESKKNFTQAEAKKLIDKWLKAPVETDSSQEEEE